MRNETNTGGPPFVEAEAYFDGICDWCGHSDDGAHNERPDAGPWGLWCPYPRDPRTPRYEEAVRMGGVQ